MKKNIIFKKNFFFLLFLCSSIFLHAQTATDYFNTSLDLYKKKQYDQCIQTLNQAIKLKPDYLYAYQVRGNAFYALRKYNLAAADYNYAANIGGPNNAINYYNLGNVYGALRLYDSALLDYNKAVSIKPDYANAYGARGSLYSHKKMYDMAIQDFGKALLLDSTLSFVYNNRGLSYTSIGQYELAVSDFKKAILLDVNMQQPFATINIIEPLARLYRFSEAANYYNDFRTKYVTGYIDAPYWNFFKKYMEAISQNISKNDFSTALANLTQAENLYSTKSKTESTDESGKRGYSSILALKGYVLEKLNNNDGAKQAYEQSLVINTNEPEVTAALQRLSQKKEILVQADNTPPVINILEPLANSRSISVDDDKVAGTKQHIRGQAVDASGIKSLMLNNLPLKVEENGYFDTVVNINPGVNIFTIVATDKNANSVSQNIQIVTGKDKTNAAPDVKPDNTVLNSNPVYHAILIAESDYTDKNIPSLQGPTSDMLKIYNLLVNNYVFAPENTDTLINATRANILESIIKKANALSENDNLFIFYAGHGQMITQPDQSEEGFLVPQDAVKDMLSTYISSDDLLRTIKYSKAKHILFVADACFAGSLFRDIPTDAPVPVAEAYKDKSRRLLASGNRTAVPDRSDFIEFLRLALQENHEHYITAEQLIDSFKNQYTNTTHLTLQYYPIKNVDDLGGQFVFMRK
jgi:tetratricopeptide (TPR) repeat protein